MCFDWNVYIICGNSGCILSVRVCHILTMSRLGVVVCTMSVLLCFFVVGVGVGATVGAIFGLVVGLYAYPFMVWFAVFEAGIPVFVVGGLFGVLVGGFMIAVIRVLCW